MWCSLLTQISYPFFYRISQLLYKLPRLAGELPSIELTSKQLQIKESFSIRQNGTCSPAPFPCPSCSSSSCCPFLYFFFVVVSFFSLWPSSRCCCCPPRAVEGPSRRCRQQHEAIGQPMLCAAFVSSFANLLARKGQSSPRPL